VDAQLQELDKRLRSIVKILKKALAAPFVLLAAILILIEDWLWDDLARLAAAIGRLPVFRQVELLIVALPPYLSLLLFAIPSALLIPVKLVALYFISHGHALLGLLTAVIAKVLGTALVARLFILTKPKLLTISWFSWLYERFVAFKARIYDAIKSTVIYRVTHRRYVLLRASIKSWFKGRRTVFRRRFDAAIKFARRRKVLRNKA